MDEHGADVGDLGDRIVELRGKIARDLRVIAAAADRLSISFSALAEVTERSADLIDPEPAEAVADG